MADPLDTKALSVANYTQVVHADSRYLPNESLIEGMYLLCVGVFGIFFNVLVLMVTFTCTSTRSWKSGFAIHGCVLEIAKSAMCIPFGWTLLNSVLPSYCASLGTGYIIGQTAGLFNLLAMVLVEAYSFHLHNLNERDENDYGAMMCTMFGLLMIYTGSVIVHLGPTFIGGELKFNRDIGNCLYAYGEIKNYIVQSMWIGITTITYIIILRYIFKFFRQLKANGKFRITALARNSVAMSRGESINESIYEVVRRLKRRVKVLFAMALINILCWYPLFMLTLADHRYERPRYIYRILTVIAFSHCAIVPLPLLSCDKSFGLWYQARDLLRRVNEAKTISSPETRKALLPSSLESSLINTPNNVKKQLNSHSGNNNVGNNVGNNVDNNATWKPDQRPPLRSSSSVRSVIRQQSYGSLKNYSPCSVRSNKTTASLYDKVNAELQELGTHLPEPSCDCDTLESRINQSRETDLLYDFNLDQEDVVIDQV